MDILKSINISGPNGGYIREHDRLFKFTCTVSSIINLDTHPIHVDIIVHPTYIRHYPDAMGLCYEKDEDHVEIHLARKCVEGLRNDLYLTLTHELLHARQTCLNQKMYERPVRKNEEFIYQLAKERLSEKNNVCRL